jgi:hypothetical protein
MLRFGYTFLLLLLFILPLRSQESPRIFINEFLASNVSIDADMVDFDDYSDWIELYNAAEYDVDIIGYYITDDLNNPYKWQFTESTIIPAAGFLRVWADGYDINPGKTRTRPYRDQNNNLIYFTTKFHHLNFSLSRAGESIGLFGPDSVLIDSLTYGLQQRDIAMGRQPDGQIAPKYCWRVDFILEVRLSQSLFHPRVQKSDTPWMDQNHQVLHWYMKPGLLLIKALY